MVPIIAAPMANASTAAAEMSFANLAFGFFSGLTMSTIVSMAVLNNSEPITRAIDNIIKHHSVIVNFRLNPANNTTNIANTWIFIFLSFSKEVLKRFTAIIAVPQSRFCTSVDLKSGKVTDLGDETAGGYEKA